MDYNDDDFYCPLFKNELGETIYRLGESQYNLVIDMELTHPTDGVAFREESGVEYLVDPQNIEGVKLLWQSHHFGWDEQDYRYVINFRLMFFASENIAQLLCQRLGLLSPTLSKGIKADYWIIDGKQVLE